MDYKYFFLIIEKLIGLALILQTIELIQIKKVFSDSGILSWQVFKRDFIYKSKSVSNLFDFFLSEESFIYLLRFRFVLLIALLPLNDFGFAHSLIVFLILFSQWLICIRCRGTFNGGSDYMTFTVLLGLFISSFGLYNLTFLKIGLYFIAAHTIFSLFISGVIKIKRQSWRSGDALNKYLLKSNYDIPEKIKSWFSNKAICFVFSWGIMLFEISFPLSLLNNKIALLYILLAILFHFSVFCIFGLNRFFFAWLAAYPAVFLCSLL